MESVLLKAVPEIIREYSMPSDIIEDRAESSWTGSVADRQPPRKKKTTIKGIKDKLNSLKEDFIKALLSGWSNIRRPVI